MEPKTMQETFDRLNDGSRIGNPAADMMQYPQDWGRNECKLMACYAEERIFSGKSHMEAASFAHRTIRIQQEPPKRTATTFTQAQWDAANAH